AGDGTTGAVVVCGVAGQCGADDAQRAGVVDGAAGADVAGPVVVVAGGVAGENAVGDGERAGVVDGAAGVARGAGKFEVGGVVGEVAVADLQDAPVPDGTALAVVRGAGAGRVVAAGAPAGVRGGRGAVGHAVAAGDRQAAQADSGRGPFDLEHARADGAAAADREQAGARPLDHQVLG